MGADQRITRDWQKIPDAHGLSPSDPRRRSADGDAIISRRVAAFFWKDSTGAAAIRIRSSQPRSIRRIPSITLPVYDVQSMTAALRASTERLAFVVLILSVATLVTLALGAVGLYGVLAMATCASWIPAELRCQCLRSDSRRARPRREAHMPAPISVVQLTAAGPVHPGTRTAPG